MDKHVIRKPARGYLWACQHPALTQGFTGFLWLRVWGQGWEQGDESRETEVENPGRKGWRLNPRGSRDGRDGWIQDKILRFRIKNLRGRLTFAHLYKGWRGAEPRRPGCWLSWAGVTLPLPRWPTAYSSASCKKKRKQGPCLLGP